MIRPVALFVAALILSSLVLVACRGGGDDGAPTVESLQPTAPSGPPGVPPLVLSAVLAADPIALAGLTFYQQEECVSESEGAGSPPVCRENEEEDQDVDVFRAVFCEAGWVRPEQVPDAYEGVLGEGDVTLFAAYVPAEGGTPAEMTADTMLVMRTASDDANPTGFALAVNGGRIVAVEADCGDFARLYAPDRVASFFVEPGTTP
jgi:hypothetical protein